MNAVPFGRSGREVSAAGLGGEGVLRTFDRREEARGVIHEAIEKGVTYFDTARVYSDSELYYGSVWKENPDLRPSIFHTSKSASRNRDDALADLHSTLKRLHMEYLDLWQIHDVRTEEDMKMISAPGGALEAFLAAKEQGLVRAIGVTGHHDPRILTRAVEEWPVDAVLLPVNPVEGVIGGFLSETLPAARNRDMAIIGMKVLGAGHYVQEQSGITAGMLVRYAMSFDITLPVIGCASPDEVRTMVEAAKQPPLALKEREMLEEVFKPHASRLAFYRGVL